jgi:hypothetical protein
MQPDAGMIAWNHKIDFMGLGFSGGNNNRFRAKLFFLIFILSLFINGQCVPWMGIIPRE